MRDKDISYLWVLVSIHAPTRGATMDKEFNDCPSWVSIHAPTRGATFHWPKYPRVMIVSIHAPTRGATRQGATLQLKAMFQSTRPRGARLMVLSSLVGHMGFNPRAHAGRDLSNWYTSPDDTRFNPRAHAGRDSRLFIITWRLFWFQSTRPRGARQ